MMKRRDLLMVAGGAAAMPLYPAAPLAFFTATEAKLAEAICDRIVPDDDDPGAAQAGVLHYLDWQLAGTLKRHGPAYRKGLAQLEQAARKETGQEFVALSPDAQTRFLEAVESGRVPGLARLFALIVDHTMQGFYGSPKHGGNRNRASWRMLGIEKHMTEEHRH